MNVADVIQKKVNSEGILFGCILKISCLKKVYYCHIDRILSLFPEETVSRVVISKNKFTPLLTQQRRHLSVFSLFCFKLWSSPTCNINVNCRGSSYSERGGLVLGNKGIHHFLLCKYIKE